MIAPRTVEPVALPMTAPAAPPAPAPIIAPFSALFMAQPTASSSRMANVSAPARERFMRSILSFLIQERDLGSVTTLLHQYGRGLGSERVRGSERPLHSYFGPLP